MLSTLFPKKLIRSLYFLILPTLLAFNSFANESTLIDKSVTVSHGFALYEDLKYPQNFEYYDFVYPDAPKGGTLNLMGFGSYDSLNPYTLKGISPFNSPGQFIWGFSELNETLLIGTGEYSPSADEPQSAYGLLAESITYPANYKWARFKIRSQSSFHDGHKIDADDVVFSYETLITKGHPRFQQTLLGIESVKALRPDLVHVEFKEANQAANILRIGEMPILPMHFWKDKDFERSTQVIPLLSGPYEISNYKIGQSITFSRKNDFWASSINGKALNAYKGRFNFDRINIDFYRAQSIAFEGFKSGNFDLFYDYMAKNWAKSYNFPAFKSGKVIREEIAHKIPSTTQAFFFNARRPIFQDRLVRKAISLMFDFEWTNKALFNNAYQRNNSYFPNSEFSATGVPINQELDLLLPFKAKLPAALFTSEFKQPITKGNGNIRQQTKDALHLLEQAGWVLKDTKLTHKDSGKIFEFEILIRQAGIQRILMPFIKNLERIGITAKPRMIDTAQYKTRLDQFDFDMTTASLGQGNAPSYEQRDYFHSSNSAIEGSQNYAGVNDLVVDALIETVLAAQSRSELITAMRALDRVLLWQHYTIPNWHINFHRLAYWDKFSRPDTTIPFKLGIENWWIKPQN